MYSMQGVIQRCAEVEQEFVSVHDYQLLEIMMVVVTLLFDF